jgi:hypothetical protein
MRRDHVMAARGLASTSMSPRRRHPTHINHVRARQKSRLLTAGDRRLPSIEPPCRRISVVPASAAMMLPEVVQHVHECIAHFDRRAQQPGMVPVGPDRATPPAHAIHEAGDPDGQPANTTLERRRPVRFHQQVEMILLNAELQNAEAIVCPGAQGVLDLGEEPFASEGRNVSAGPQRDMGRTSRLVRGAPLVRDVSPAFLALASSAVARATPGPGSELQLCGRRRILNSAENYHDRLATSSRRAVRIGDWWWLRG